jgi:hypothetical protein
MIRENLKWQTHKRESTKARHAGGTSHSRSEALVMRVDRRGVLSSFITKKTVWQPAGRTEMIKTKPFTISKDIVLQAYLRVIRAV